MGVSVSSLLSDHFLINTTMYRVVSAKVISSRKYKSIDGDAFLADPEVSSLVLDPQDDILYLVDLYNITLRDLVDEHASLGTKEMPRMSLLPWYNNDIWVAKRHRRYYEAVDREWFVC